MEQHLSTMVQHICDLRGCYSCLHGVFHSTSESEMPPKYLTFPSTSCRRSDGGLPVELHASDGCTQGEISAEQPELLAAYIEDNAMWIPHIDALRTTAPARAISLPGSLPHSEEDSDGDSSTWMVGIKNARKVQKTAQRAHLDKLQTFQRSVELQPGKLSKQILSSRLANDQLDQLAEAKEASQIHIEYLSEPMPQVNSVHRQHSDSGSSCDSGSSYGHLSQ